MMTSFFRDCYNFGRKQKFWILIKSDEFFLNRYNFGTKTEIFYACNKVCKKDWVAKAFLSIFASHLRRCEKKG